MKKKIVLVLELVLALTSIMATIWLVQKAEEQYAFLDWRYALHQRVHNFAAGLKGKPLIDNDTIVVLIGDNEFWKGSYAGRLPLNKASLAQLLLSLSEFGPRVIAMDFNFASPTADGSLTENEVYRDETKTFANAVKVASAKSTIVLTKFLHVVDQPNDGYYIALPNRFDSTEPNVNNFAKFGYINLANDFRFVPLTITLKDGDSIDSFPEAIVRSFDLTGKKLDIDQDGVDNYCGAYLDQSRFVVHYADEIEKANKQQLEELKRAFAGKIVIVGAGWAEYAAPDPTDKSPVRMHDSQVGPGGSMPAVFIHANLVESILAERTGRQLSDHWRSVIEFILGLLAFLLFRGWLPGVHDMPRLLKLLRFFYFPVVVLMWIVVSYLFFQNLGLFVDPIAGLVGAVLGAAERGVSTVLKWRKAALRARTEATAT